jgi:long-chain acyl-CoA synthetase
LSLPVISRITRVEPAALNASANLADDLKLDSLGRVELLSALEDQYQIELDEAAITEATTIADIERIVSRGKSEAVAYPYPGWAMRAPVTWIRFIFYHVFLLPLTLIMCRVRAIGVERFARVKPPVLFISNHVTDVDAALILSALPWRWRYRTAIAMQGELLREWRYPPATMGLLARMKSKVTYALGAAFFNVFSLPRKSGFRQSFAYAGEAVDRGFSILIFPEGTETRDGQLQPFKAGIGLLASELKVPVVPIMLRGLFEVKQRKQRFVKPNTVSITFGAPITFSEDTAAEVTRQLESRLRAMEESF